MELEESDVLSKRVKQTENMVKLGMQKLLSSFQALAAEQEGGTTSPRKLSYTADNSVNNPEIAGTSSINNDNSLDSKKEAQSQSPTSIEEMQ